MVSAKLISNYYQGSPVAGLRGPFTEVMVMGMYHSGTNALVREIQHNFQLPVYPTRPQAFHPDGTWKHTLRPTITAPRTRLHCVLVKDPYFWFQSVSRCPYELQCQRSGPQGQTTISDLFRPVQLQGRQFPHLAEVWNAYLRNYLDNHCFSPHNTIIIPFSSLLTEYHQVMTVLARYLPAKSNHLAWYQPFRTASKHHGRACRNRAEAIAYYQPENRYVGFTPAQVAQLAQQLHPYLLTLVGYQLPEVPIPRPTSVRPTATDSQPKVRDEPVLTDGPGKLLPPDTVISTDTITEPEAEPPGEGNPKRILVPPEEANSERISVLPAEATPQIKTTPEPVGTPLINTTPEPVETSQIKTTPLPRQEAIPDSVAVPPPEAKSPATMVDKLELKSVSGSVVQPSPEPIQVAQPDSKTDPEITSETSVKSHSVSKVPLAQPPKDTSGPIIQPPSDITQRWGLEIGPWGYHQNNRKEQSITDRVDSTKLTQTEASLTESPDTCNRTKNNLDIPSEQTVQEDQTIPPDPTNTTQTFTEPPTYHRRVVTSTTSNNYTVYTQPTQPNFYQPSHPSTTTLSPTEPGNQTPRSVPAPVISTKRLFHPGHPKALSRTPPPSYLPNISQVNGQVIERLLSNGRVGIDQLYHDVVMRRRLINFRL